MNPVSTVLVVEDDPILNELICDVLSSMDLDFVAASTADEGRALYADSGRQWGLVLTDITTPGASTGEDLAWDVYRTAPDIPVIVCSGYLGTRANSLPPGVHTLPKPWVLDQFEAKISLLIGLEKEARL
jgi:DNA-binding NtrC family response regulator